MIHQIVQSWTPRNLNFPWESHPEETEVLNSGLTRMETFLPEGDFQLLRPSCRSTVKMAKSQWWAGPHLTRTAKICIAPAFLYNWNLTLGLWVRNGKLYLFLRLPSEATLRRSFYAFQYWSGSFNLLKNKWPSLACRALAVITKVVTLSSYQSPASSLPDSSCWPNFLR